MKEATNIVEPPEPVHVRVPVRIMMVRDRVQSSYDGVSVKDSEFAMVTLAWDESPHNREDGYVIYGEWRMLAVIP